MFSMSAVIRESLPVGPFQCNAFIVGNPDTKDVVVIDPGGEVFRILNILEKEDLKVKHILLTHGHIDHASGAKDLKEATGAEVLMHKEDLFLYENMPLQASLFGMEPPPVTDIDILLEDGMEIGQGPLRCNVIHTPGHTPGSVCFYFPDMIFTGDTLFRGGVGRTDLWGGSYELLADSIRGILLNLDDAIEVYPGHGPSTTIGREKRENPFIKEMWDGA